MDFERYTEFSEARIYKEPERIPEWARMEKLDVILPLRTLWKFITK